MLEEPSVKSLIYIVFILGILLSVISVLPRYFLFM